MNSNHRHTTQPETDPLAQYGQPSGSAAAVRIALAAVHVTMKESYRSVTDPGADPAPHIDWAQTMEIRRQLDSAGFGIAEAMDTAQRYELGWNVAKRLIEDTGHLELANGFVAGAGIDHLPSPRSVDEISQGWSFQSALIQGAGGMPVLLCIPELISLASSEDEFVRAYAQVISSHPGPLLIHWLGAAFHPGLADYFPGNSFMRIMALDPTKVLGCKLSLLDADFERRTRRALMKTGQIVLTGDDFNYPDLIVGESQDHIGEIEFLGRSYPRGDFSHALLGVFNAISRPASLALAFLRDGNAPKAHAILKSTEPLARMLFEEPTQHYKTGLAHLAWINGRQPNPMLPFHGELSRSAEHLQRVAQAAADCGSTPISR